MDSRGLKDRERTFGSWITIGHPIVAELMAQAGFDWLAVDTEHGAIDLPQAQVLFQAMRAGNPACVPFVRLVGNQYEVTKRYLDAGAMGVIVPLVKSADEAREAVKSVKYPPEGERGVGITRAHMYGPGFEDYMARANRETVVVVQIEHTRSVENIEEILAVPGVDVVFMGPYDLSASMGITAQFDHPRMKTAIKRVLQACENAKVLPGIHVVPPSIDEVKRRLDEGFRFIAYSLDILMLGEMCREGLKEIKKLRDVR